MEEHRQQQRLPAVADGRMNAPANSNIQAVWKLNELELRHNVEGEASWHWQYRHSSYIYIGGLDVRLTEGDVIVVFSQWGEPVDIHLVRDRRTEWKQNKTQPVFKQLRRFYRIPHGFAFLAYADQRSTILAVDNANGMRLLHRTLHVDHCKQYRPPETQKAEEKAEAGAAAEGEANAESSGSSAYKATGAEGKGIGIYGVTRDQQQRFAAEEQQRKLLQQNRMQEKQRAARLQQEGGKDVDEMWCEEFEEMLLQMNKEAEAEAQQLLEADATRRRQQKKIEKEAKKAWKKERKMLQRKEEEKEKGEEGEAGAEGKEERKGREFERKKRERQEKKEEKKKKDKRSRAAGGEGEEEGEGARRAGNDGRRGKGGGKEGDDSDDDNEVERSEENDGRQGGGGKREEKGEELWRRRRSGALEGDRKQYEVEEAGRTGKADQFRRKSFHERYSAERGERGRSKQRHR